VGRSGNCVKAGTVRGETLSQTLGDVVSTRHNLRMPNRNRAVNPPSAGPVWCAFVDESMRLNSDNAGTYLMAAVVTEVGRCEEIRQILRSLLYKRQERLHWRDEEAPRRTKIAEAVGGLDVAATVVIGTPLAKKKQERARRKCLETLLPRLDEMGVTQVVLERRTPSLVAADRKMVIAIRGKRLIGAGLRVETAQPKDEPMLWLPDAVAGAFGAARDAGQPEFLALIGSVEQIEVSTL
jgi:hypothetical protein